MSVEQPGGEPDDAAGKRKGLERDDEEVVDAELVEEIERRAEEAAIRVVGAYWSGPLPPPAELQGYESVLPGSAERILGMAEREAGHRHAMDREIVQTDGKTRTRAQLLAFGIAIVALVVAAALGLTGHGLTGIGTLLIGLAPIVGSFLTGRSNATAQLPRAPEDSSGEGEAELSS